MKSLRNIGASLVLTPLVALAVAGKINEYEPRLAHKPCNLLAPETKIARPAMNENQGAISPSGGDIMNPVRAGGNKM